MSAISDFLLWLEEEYPEVIQDTGIPPKYCTEYLDMVVAKREAQETE